MVDYAPAGLNHTLIDTNVILHNERGAAEQKYVSTFVLSFSSAGVA